MQPDLRNAGLPEPPPSVSLRNRLGTRLFLAAVLLAAVIGSAWGLILVAMGGGVEDTLSSTPSTVPQRLVILTMCGLVNAGSAVGAWSFRRWGIYGVVCASLVAFIANWKLGGVHAAVPGLIGAASVCIFAMSLWVEFD